MTVIRPPVPHPFWDRPGPDGPSVGQSAPIGALTARVIYRVISSDGDTPWLAAERTGSDRQQVAGAGVTGRMPQLRHGASLDLAYALAREVEVLAHLFEGARLTAVEAEAQPQDLALPFIERTEQPGDLVGQQRRGRHLEW